MNPDGTGDDNGQKTAQKIVAKNLRNAVAMQWDRASSTLYLTNMGDDQLGNHAPEDPFFAIPASRIEAALATNHPLDYGWPYCYFENGTVHPDPVFGKLPNAHCDHVPAAYTTFTAHSSPLGFVLFPSTDTLLKDTFLIALHGAGHPRIGTGYSSSVHGERPHPAGLPHRLLPAHQNSRQARRRPRPRPPLRHLPHRPRQLLSHRRHPGHHLRHLSRASVMAAAIGHSPPEMQ